MRVSSLKASMSSSVVSFAIVGVLPVKVLLEWSKGGLHRPPHGLGWAYWDFACAIRLLLRLLLPLLPRARAASLEARPRVHQPRRPDMGSVLRNTKVLPTWHYRYR